ncbi:MAG: acyltransferase [Proteobacteria bacterium]|nr:acyltransferase [Pseudomonadota bacterium]
MRYRNEIDGLRAIAVIPVVLFHAGLKTFSGGFVGVDIFFVISGYLITSIILSKIDDNNFSLTEFYERRARRILPALFLVMGVTIPMAWLWMDPFELKEFGQSLISTATFSSNIFFQLKTGYFNTSSELKPLLHTWSLAVEEQYYIIFPLLIMLVHRLGRTTLILTLVTITLTSLALAQWAAYNSPSFASYSLPTRMWEILLGSFVALYFQRSDKIIQIAWLNQTLSFAGLLLIFYSIAYFDAHTPFPSLYTLVPTIGAALVIIFAQPHTIAHRLLASRIMVGIGVISYSVYLWHQPVFSMARIYTLKDLSFGWNAACTIITFALAYLTKLSVEDYFRFRLTKQNRFKALGGLSAFAICLIAFGISSHINLGFPERSSLGLKLSQNFGLSSACSGAALDEQECKTGESPSTVLWGDSFAMHIAKAVNANSEKGMIQATLSACPPIAGYRDGNRKSLRSCEEFNNDVLSYVEHQSKENVRTVVLSSTFQKFTKPQQKKFLNTLKHLKSLGLNVYVVSPPPVHPNTLRCIKLMDRENKPIDSCTFNVSKIRNRNTFKTLAKICKKTGATFIDLRDLICLDGKCTPELNGTIIYRDNGHLSNMSTEIVSEFLKSKML